MGIICVPPVWHHKEELTKFREENCTKHKLAYVKCINQIKKRNNKSTSVLLGEGFLADRPVISSKLLEFYEINLII